MNIALFSPRQFSLLLVLVLAFGCTNYSTTASVQAPPTLISITNNGNSNYTVKVRAQNPEFIFQGYRLYSGASENLAQNPTDLNIGASCFLAQATVVQPIEYTFEIDESTNPNTTGVSCRIFATLTPGTYIAMRTLGLAVNLQNSTSSFKVSMSSNALIVP
ncbi:LIC11661 family lipoprotein [Leptospira terpstrae]|uniref:LIC11661 family lipoprotein n=1 Tax=Leptospira terpstrae TaxID=293075 RepID=UPI003D03F8FC